MGHLLGKDAVGIIDGVDHSESTSRHDDPADSETISAYVDAMAPGLSAADFAIVFGTVLTEPVPLAAHLYLSGLAPKVLVTGGPNPHKATHNEADAHRQLLQRAGVPSADVIIERASTNTYENVRWARPLIEAAIGRPTTAIAVVKWYHYRAVLILARQLPSLQRIYTVTYDPRYPPSGVAISRANWTATGRARVHKEYLAIQDQLRDGTLSDLQRNNDGWVRDSGLPSSPNGPDLIGR